MSLLVTNPMPVAPGGTLWATVDWAIDRTVVGNYGVGYLDAINENAIMNLQIPPEFSSIVEAVIIVFPASTQAAAAYSISSEYCLPGEAYNAASESDLTSTYNVVNTVKYEVDISSILTGIAAGDSLGVKLLLRTAAHMVNVVGTRIRWK